MSPTSNFLPRRSVHSRSYIVAQLQSLDRVPLKFDRNRVGVQSLKLSLDMKATRNQVVHVLLLEVGTLAVLGHRPRRGGVGVQPAVDIDVIDRHGSHYFGSGYCCSS